MIQFIQNTLGGIFGQIGFIPVLVTLYIIAMLLFWWESKNVKKDSNSIFDQWFLSSLLMIAWGRITFIIAEWQQFFGGFWFYAPYEVYDKQVYIFRAMPWKLFRVWDGGFLFISMFLAFLVINFIYVVLIKKWRWREMMLAVLQTANFLLSSTLIVYGIFISSVVIIENGLYLLGFSAIFHLLISLMRFVYRNRTKAFVRLAQVLIIIFAMLNIWLVSYIFLSQEITTIDTVHVYAFIVFGVFMLATYIYDVRRGNVEEDIEETSLEELKRTVTLNQSFKVGEK